MKLINRQTGIGLIEALIAALVFAIGIAALVRLQGTFFKNSGDANARSVAMSIAQEKMEDLRGFQIADSADNDIFDFTSIGTNTGGRCTEQIDNDACTPSLASTGTNRSIAAGNQSFSRNWTVTDYYYTNLGALTTPVPNGTIPDQKRITVSVTWTDSDNSNQTIALEGLINRNSGVSMGSVTDFNGAGGSGSSPIVPYTPSTDVHVVPVGVGTNTKRETLVPSSTTVDGFSRTKFIAYTYNNTGGLVREEEFQNVACNCRFNGTSDDNNKTYAAAHSKWDAAKDTYIDVDGELVSGKVKGCVQGGGSNCDANPEPFCDVCCRDHHDISSAARKFDPFRSSDDFTGGGDHKHYSGTTPVTSGQYLESCRFKRVDGFWRVFQDWHMINFTVLPLTDLTDTALVNGQTKKTVYQNYVKSFTDAHIDESKVSGQALTSTPSKPSELNHTVSGNYVTMAVGNKRELTARGLYLDFIDSEHLTKVQAKKTAGQDYLLHLPFYELEVAPQGSWLSSISTKVRVGPHDENPGTANDLTGGQLHALNTESNAVVITGTIKRSDSGIVALNQATDYNAATNPDLNTRSDSVNVCVNCTTAADCQRPWGGTVSNGSSITAYQSESVPFGNSCVSQTRTCTNGNLSGSYSYSSCSVLPSSDCAAPWGIAVSNGGSVTAYQTATVVSPATCASETRTCTSGTLSGSYTAQTCTVLPTTCTSSVSGTASGSNRTYSISVDGGSAIACTLIQTQITPPAYRYTCPTQTVNISGTTIVVSQVLAGSPTQTITITPNSICGAPIANF